MIGEEKNSNSWGGARAGAGRKPQAGERLKQKNVFLTSKQEETFKLLGGTKWLRDVLDAEGEKLRAGKEKEGK